MHLLASREYPVIDYQTMAEFTGRERLFRAVNGAFLLYMSSDWNLGAEVRIMWLTARETVAIETPARLATSRMLTDAMRRFEDFFEGVFRAAAMARIVTLFRLFLRGTFLSGWPKTP